MEEVKIVVDDVSGDLFAVTADGEVHIVKSSSNGAVYIEVEEK